MEFFDAHNHLNDGLFKDSWREVAGQASEAGVVGMVVNGGDVASSKRAVEMAAGLEGVYVAVGVHPEVFLEDERAGLRFDIEAEVSELRRLAQNKKVVAVGELGLDYAMDMERASKNAQQELIEPQLDLARELGLPVVLHVRDVPGSQECFEDVLSLLDNFAGIQAQFHCWTGDATMAERVVERGFYVSFSGILTYKSAGVMVEAARVVPDNRLLIETDGPFLVPEPKRTEMRKTGMRNSERVCRPEYVIMTGRTLALVRQQQLEEVAAITTANARRLFGLER